MKDADVSRWEKALAEADALLDTDWRVNHDHPGHLIRGSGNVPFDNYQTKIVGLDVWYLRRAMTIGVGFASERERKG